MKKEKLETEIKKENKLPWLACGKEIKKIQKKHQKFSFLFYILVFVPKKIVLKNATKIWFSKILVKTILTKINKFTKNI